MAENTTVKTSDNKKPGAFSRLIKYLRSVRSEFKKVVWPSKKQLANNTAIVIAFIVISGVCIGVLDLILRTGIDSLLQR
jgi:preprotein translocase subunit SecE